MKRSLVPLILATAASLTACGDAMLDPAGATGPDLRAESPANALSVLGWNLYIGTDVDAVFEALVSPDPNDDLQALLDAVATLVATDFPSRAAAVADAIASRRPHVVALNEVSTVDLDLSGLGLPIAIHLDFLPTLQAALAARGLNYDLAAIVTNIVATPIPGVTVVDQDALLVDPSRVNVLSSDAQNFSNNVGPIAPGVSLVRGWVQVTADVDGQTYTVANTHLEPDLAGLDFSGLRALQAAELMTALGATAPAIVMGDLNDSPGSLMHGIVTGAGFTDVWAALRPGAQGLTCCHLPDLSDKVANFDQRIDYVFARGLANRAREVMGRMDRLGEVPGDRVDGPQYAIWPSDHVGLAVDLLLPPGGGLVAGP
jgi:endonuclease/exonuclease/phosphatase family metal-dependent hydrolase